MQIVVLKRFAVKATSQTLHQHVLRSHLRLFVKQSLGMRIHFVTLWCGVCRAEFWSVMQVEKPQHMVGPHVSLTTKAAMHHRQLYKPLVRDETQASPQVAG